MTGGVAIILVGLSLIDSTSFGTLLIPVWLLLTPGKIKAGRITAYLVTVVIFYFAIGLALAAGADTLVEVLREPLAVIPSVAWRTVQAITGIGLIILSYYLEARINRRQESQTPGTPGRLARWRSRALEDADHGGATSVVKLALVGTSLEVLTMLPYLAAIGILTAADLSHAGLTAGVAAYCLLMILPAVILTIARLTMHERLTPVLTRINNWFSRLSGKAVGWTVGGIGIGILVNAVINMVILTTS